MAIQSQCMRYSEIQSLHYLPEREENLTVHCFVVSISDVDTLSVHNAVTLTSKVKVRWCVLDVTREGQGQFCCRIHVAKMTSAIPLPISLPPYHEWTSVDACSTHGSILMGVPLCVTIIVLGLAATTAAIISLTEPGSCMSGRSKPSLSQSRFDRR